MSNDRIMLMALSLGEASLPTRREQFGLATKSEPLSQQADQ